MAQMIDERPFLKWNVTTLRRFKAAYKLALERHGGRSTDTFNFEGYPYVIGYAKHVIECLESTLKP